METLWAPWRMEYISASKEDGGCFLCRAAAEGADEQTSLVVHKSRTCMVVLNRYPYNNGHLLLAPRRHIAEPADLSDDESRELMALLSRSIAVLRAEMRPDGFNAGLNLGRVAGAGLDTHLHWHVVPRWSGDSNFMPVIASTKVIPEALEDQRRRLASAFAAAR